MRRLPLRSRLAIISAVAVAIAIGAVAFVSYVAVRDRLHTQMDKSIAGNGDPGFGQHFGPPRNGWDKRSPCDLMAAMADPGEPADPADLADPSDPAHSGKGNFPSPAVSVTFYNGIQTCPLPGSTAVQGQISDLQEAYAPPDRVIWRDGVTTTGAKVRVEVVANPNPYHPGVFLKSQPYQPIDDSLSSLAWLLFAV